MKAKPLPVVVLTATFSVGLTPKKNSVLAGMKASFVVAVGLAPITK